MYLQGSKKKIEFQKSIGYCFVPACNYAQKSHQCPLFVFLNSFSAIFAGPPFVKIQNFATKAKRCNDFPLFFFLPCHNKQFSNHPSSFTNKFLHQFRSRNSNECALSVVCYSSGKQCLACTWWTIQ